MCLNLLYYNIRKRRASWPSTCWIEFGAYYNGVAVLIGPQEPLNSKDSNEMDGAAISGVASLEYKGNFAWNT